MTGPAAKHRVSLDEVATADLSKGRDAFLRKPLGRTAGGQQLGASWYRLAPGERSWPAHSHAVNEEALFILNGSGQLRLGDSWLPIKAQDYVALPADKALHHQLHNDGDVALEYLCVSTMQPVDVTFYPDTATLRVFVGSAPGGDAALRVHDQTYPQSLEREP